MLTQPSPLARVSQSLAQALQRYGGQKPAAASPSLQQGLEQLQLLSNRLSSNTLRVAVFGLVSRGKSAVINALVGQPVLETGPLHGVTRWPRSIYWQPPLTAEPAVEPAVASESVAIAPLQVEFIDTPGLDEIEGEARAEMANAIAQQADLILFVVAGNITSAEYTALQQLQAAQKPLLLIFNKIDLYPSVDRDTILKTLEQLRQQSAPAVDPGPAGLDQVIGIAADPAPVQVRIEWPNGEIAHQWEKPAPQIEPLRTAMATLLGRDRAALIALNTLRQARQLEAQLVSQVSQLHQGEADDLIWRFARYKALAVALNPVSLLDVAGGLLCDLVMIRALARLYGFPITSYEASQLWRALVKSSGVLLLAEASSVVLGAGKPLSALLSPIGLPALGGIVVGQAAASGYGTYAVGQAAKRYLEQGCTWGPDGISQVMQTVLAETETSEPLARLRQSLEQSLRSPTPNS